MLSDRTIKEMMDKGEISILTPDSHFPSSFPTQIQTVSVDLRLGDLEGWISASPVIDHYWIRPGVFILGSTLEVVKLSNNIAGIVHGKSTRARQGLSVHAAGLVDPGFNGQLTLEIFNMSNQAISLAKGDAICQISFSFLSASPDRPYGHPDLGSHYQGQYGPTPARF